MNTKDAIRTSMEMSLFVLDTYLSDLSDADLMRRPGPGCNHLAWQLGHLIQGESQLVNAVCPGQGAVLPEGFAAQHSKGNNGNDNPAGFLGLQAYRDLFQMTRVATLAALAALPDADLDRESPEGLNKHFPTVGHVFTLVALHPLMHSGQVVVLRRQLGKPVLI